MSQTLRIRLGDSFEVLKTFEEGSIGAVVCDPPYSGVLYSLVSSIWALSAFIVDQSGAPAHRFPGFIEVHT